MNKRIRLIPFYPVFFLIYMAIVNKGIGLRRLHIFIAFIIRYIISEPLRWIEIVCFERKIIRHELNMEPIFIIGHWRSGTTRLQQLLNIDDRNTTSSVYQFLFIDIFITTEKWLKIPLNWICKKMNIPYSFQRVPLNLDLPGELEAGMSSFCSPYSYTWGHLFSKTFANWAERMILLNNKDDSTQWLNDYEYLIKKLSYTSGGKRVIIKSPGDTGRISFLMTKFPDAKFVYIERDPIAVYHSSKYFWDVIRKEVSFQTITDKMVHEYIINTYVMILSLYKATKANLPADQLIEISFNELTCFPKETIQKVYDDLNLGTFHPSSLDQLISQEKEHKLGKYDTSPKLLAELQQAWKDVADFS